MISLLMTQIWQLVLLWGIVVGIGTGLTAMVLAATVATRWFNHRRGLVMGILMRLIGLGFAMAVVLLILIFLATHGKII